MHETPWLSAVAVLCGGLAVGGLSALALSFRARHRRGAQAAGAGAGRSGVAVAPSDSNSPHESLEQHAQRSADTLGALADLRSRRDQLLEQLRDLEDTATAAGAGESPVSAERAELERQAALVMRELAQAEGPGGVAAPAEAAAAAGGGAELRGAIKALGVAGVLGLVGFALWQGVRPRTEGMGITGNDQEVSGEPAERSMAGGDHPTEGQAGPLRPQDTPRLRQARAAVQADPSSVEALVEQGYALAEAGGWIDLYQNAQAILAREPDNADALIQSAMLRYAMRQPDQADALIDRVLQSEPGNVRALEVGGRLALRAQNWSRASKLLAVAAAKLGPGSALEPLLREARQRAARAPQPSAAQAGQAQQNGASQRDQRGAVNRSSPPTAAGAAPGSAAASTAPTAGASGAVAGTIALAAGLRAPPGGVLFVMARPAGVTAGPPVAATRLPTAGFPVAFRLDGSHAMMGGALPPKVTLSARLDADGNVATKQPQDLVGGVSTPVDLGTNGVEIVLRRSKPAGG